ncbi:MAG: DinB family protein [Planctomycetaceae bacterium]
MSTIAISKDLIAFNRTRTLATLDDIARQPNPAAILGFRPGPGRAHIAWQFLHVGITEELFATERMVPGTTPAYADLVPRFKGGSTPDDDIPELSLIRKVLEESRGHLLATLDKFSDADLPTIFPWFKERGWTFGRVLQVLCWHEGHHQGQAHISYNLWKGAHGK